MVRLYHSTYHEELVWSIYCSIPPTGLGVPWRNYKWETIFLTHSSINSLTHSLFNQQMCDLCLDPREQTHAWLEKVANECLLNEWINKCRSSEKMNDQNKVTLTLKTNFYTSRFRLVLVADNQKLPSEANAWLSIPEHCVAGFRERQCDESEIK